MSEDLKVFLVCAVVVFVVVIALIVGGFHAANNDRTNRHEIDLRILDVCEGEEDPARCAEELEETL